MTYLACDLLAREGGACARACGCVRARLRLSYAGVRFDTVGKVVFDETTQNRIRVGRAIGVPRLLVDLIN